MPEPSRNGGDIPKPARNRFAIDEIRTALSDGMPVLLRPIRPDDKAMLVDGFARLSEESRLRRFMAPIHELTPQQLEYLTEVDDVDHSAWVAVLRDRPEFVLGVGRFIRIVSDPAVAEAAITVVDDYQGLGLGTLLLGVLAAKARTSGIEKFRAYVLEDNVAMRALLEGLGIEARHDAPGVVVMDAPLDPEKLPDSPAGRAFRAIAASLVPAKARIEL